MIIPKRLLYYWHGDFDPSGYVKDWPKVVPGFEVCKIDDEAGLHSEPKFVADARDRGLWAFVSDYWRLRALYEVGGVYLDTDVRLLRPFSEEMMASDVFLGFINSASIGTAVIGSTSGQRLIGELLGLYEGLNFVGDGRRFAHVNYPEVEFVNNNDLFTFFLLTRVPGFKLDGRMQRLECFGGNVVFYPKEEFEMGDIFKRGTAVHECWGSWRNGSNSKNVLKRLVANLPFIDVRSISLHLKNGKRSSRMPFYRADDFRKLYGSSSDE